jgi:diphthamide synthase (EF-2-diphthine--ammonia ligase)
LLICGEGGELHGGVVDCPAFGELLEQAGIFDTAATATTAELHFLYPLRNRKDEVKFRLDG